MKIYHKKNFAAGLFFTLLGAAFIVLFLVKILLMYLNNLLK